MRQHNDFEIIADQLRERWRIRLTKTSVTVFGVEPGAPTWEGTVTRIRQHSRKDVGRYLEIDLKEVTVSDQPGKVYAHLYAYLRAEDTVTVIAS